MALLRGALPVSSRFADPSRPASETLLPEVDALLCEAGLEIEEVEGFVVSTGPGSFTGIRVGLATCKGLAFGAGPVAVAVPTLAALARSAGSVAEPVVALLDARRGEVHAACYESRGERAHPALPAGVYAPEALRARLPEGALLVGGGVAVLEAGGSLAGWRCAEPAREPLALRVGELGAALWARGSARDAAALLPTYGRRAEAEVKRTGLRFEAGPGSA